MAWCTQEAQLLRGGEVRLGAGGGGDVGWGGTWKREREEREEGRGITFKLTLDSRGKTATCQKPRHVLQWFCSITRFSQAHSECWEQKAGWVEEEQEKERASLLLSYPHGPYSCKLHSSSESFSSHINIISLCLHCLLISK